MKYLSSLIVISLLLSNTVFAAGDLRNQLTEEEFNRFGLQKLSEAELKALSNWINGTVEEEKTKVVEEIIPSGDNRR